MSFIKSLLLVTLLCCGGCYSARQVAEAPPDRLSQSTSADLRKTASEPQLEKVSLNQADQSQSMADAMNRKIIRNAELNLEIRDPAEGQRKITSIAESLGGFVVTSESKQSDTQDPTKKELEVNLVVRVPALQYNSALEQIRAVGSRVIQEKTSGQDVTEDFIDLEARIKTQKALELQFLEIMKQANNVGDALEIQRQIADVRTEIEKLEGRKRFLENRASLSTISVSLRTPAAIAVNTAGFGRNVKIAFSDSFAIATGIVLFLIRFVMIMVPVTLLIILPGALLARYLFRLAQRWKPATQSPSPESD
jgi:Domain of unknown function (DUF4349)